MFNAFFKKKNKSATIQFLSTGELNNITICTLDLWNDFLFIRRVLRAGKSFAIIYKLTYEMIKKT